MLGRIAFSITLWCLGLAFTQAQNTCVIQGVISDALSGAPLPYVNVSIDNAAYGAVSLPDGSFIVTGIPPGSYGVRISCIGYIAHEQSITLSQPGDSVILNNALQSTYILTDEVQVTASKRAKALHLAPASAVVLKAEAIRKRQIQTFDQAIEDVPGVSMTRSGGSNVQSLSIRGASETAGGGIGNRVLLLIDGRPSVSPESGGALWNLVPLNSVERIEIVKGAYSALFGSAAMGGVIQAVTRRPAAESETRLLLNYGFYDKAPAYTNYNRMGSFHSIGLSRSHRHGRFGYLFDVSRQHNDGHREKSAFDLHNIFGKFTYDLRGNRNLSLSINYNDMFNDTPASWLSSLDPLRVAEYRKDDFQDRQEASVDALYSAFTKSNLKYSSRFYYYGNRSEFLFNDDPLNDSTNVNFGKQFIDREVVRTRRIGHITQFDVAFDDSHYLIAGIDLKYDRTAGLPDTVLYGKHNVVQAGVYLQDEWTLSNQWILTMGARFDYYSIVDTYSETNVSPKIAMVYSASDRVSMRALIAQAFRNPPIAERFIKFEQGGGLTFQPNPELRAERLNFSAEVGVNWRIADGMMLDGALFYNRYRNLISFLQVPGPGFTFQVVNLKKALMQGFEVSLRYRASDLLSLQSGYTFLDASDISSERINDALAYKAKHTFSASANIDYEQWHLSVHTRARSRIEEVFIYPGSEPDAYFSADAQMRYDISEHYQLSLNINNIGHAQYEELERYRLPGRSFSIGFRAQW